jgi:membrane-bound lytic murein transglycosylase F
MKKWTVLICTLVIQGASTTNTSFSYALSQRIPKLKQKIALELPDVLMLKKAIATNLPQLKPVFRHYAKDFNLDWRFVAAVAYQESTWKTEAVSYTGVKGIMMLTEETAEHLGVSDRTDLHQSVWGGSKYLRELMNAQPKHLSKQQKMILALISYNLGKAHLMDAQELAVQYGLDPYSWKDLRWILPLLSDPSVFENLEYGAARGYETVAYVDRVMSYYSVLTEPKQSTVVTQR